MSLSTENNKQYNLYNLQKMYVPEIEQLGYGKATANLAVKDAFRRAEFETTFNRGLNAGILWGLGIVACSARPLAALIPDQASPTVLFLMAFLFPAAVASAVTFLTLNRVLKQAAEHSLFSSQLDPVRLDPAIVQSEKKRGIERSSTYPRGKNDFKFIKFKTAKGKDSFLEFIAAERAAVRPDAAGSLAVFAKADRILSNEFGLVRKTKGWLFPSLK
ncbi:MAG: hypothetical protein PHE27_02005 [Alphaproteobacteria bacterium]|nr:hypothetical protein [Alphaproteobacteria bacterium]